MAQLTFNLLPMLSEYCNWLDKKKRPRKWDICFLPRGDSISWLSAQVLATLSLSHQVLNILKCISRRKITSRGKWAGSNALVLLQNSELKHDRFSFPRPKHLYRSIRLELASDHSADERWHERDRDKAICTTRTYYIILYYTILATSS